MRDWLRLRIMVLRLLGGQGTLLVAEEQRLLRTMNAHGMD
jgi:hypothetical protein